MLLTILVTIDIALSTATLIGYIEYRRQQRVKERLDELKEAMNKIDSDRKWLAELQDIMLPKEG